MEATQEYAQLNVRLPRAIKSQGDATLAMVGSSPVRIIRKLWTKLAQGGEAYERISQALSDDSSSVPEAAVPSSSVLRSSQLFESLGASLGLDVAAFVPSGVTEDELMEDIEWARLVERGLA